MIETIFYAREPTFRRNGSRTHEYWIQIDKDEQQFIYSFGDERGEIDSFVSCFLSSMIEKVREEMQFFDMKIEKDKTDNELNPNKKEKVQFI